MAGRNTQDYADFDVGVVRLHDKQFEYRKRQGRRYRAYIPKRYDGMLPKEMTLKHIEATAIEQLCATTPEVVQVAFNRGARACNEHGQLLIKADGSGLTPAQRKRARQKAKKHGKVFYKCPLCDVGLWGLDSFSTPAPALLRKMRSEVYSIRADGVRVGGPIGLMNLHECLEVIEYASVPSAAARWRQQMDDYLRCDAGVRLGDSTVKPRARGRSIRVRD